MGIRRVLAGFGVLLVGAGTLLLLFTAYQLWGTSLAESHTQAGLRAKLQRELPHPLHHDAVPQTSGPPSLAGPTLPPPEGQPVGLLRIPSIGVDQVVVQGVGENDLTRGPGHYPGTSMPGEAGNTAIAGHRTTWGHPFYSLDAVPRGARVDLTTTQGSFVYTTRSIFVVSPDDTAVLAPTAVPSLTLTTCNPRYSAAQRLVLRAVLTASTLSGAVAHTPYQAAQASISPRTHNASLGGATSGSWLSVALWGAAVLAACIMMWLLARRFRHGWVLYVPGIPGVLVLLYFFFASINPHLPATF